MRQTRRQFIQTSTFVAAALPLFGAASSKLPIGFSTLGCPGWEWGKVLDFAQTNGFSAIELRGLQGDMDLPSRPEFAAARIEQSKKEVAAHGLRISCVSSSAHMHETDPAKHEAQLEDARKFIDLASTLGAPNVRVFGNDKVGTRDEMIEHIGGALRQLGEYAAPKNVTVIIESHGDVHRFAYFESNFGEGEPSACSFALGCEPYFCRREGRSGGHGCAVRKIHSAYSFERFGDAGRRVALRAYWDRRGSSQKTGTVAGSHWIYRFVFV